MASRSFLLRLPPTACRMVEARKNLVSSKQIRWEKPIRSNGRNSVLHWPYQHSSSTRESHSVAIIGKPPQNALLYPNSRQSVLESHPMPIHSRSFASRRRKGPNGKKKTGTDILSNEALVGQLIRNAEESSAEKVTVRLVMDEGPDEPSTVEILSLSEAIELSLDRELDLVGANINGDPPVIRATQLSKLEYKHKQAQKKQQQATANKKELKAFRFRAGIEANDLERKLDRLKGFLSKGHDCEFTVFTKMRTLRQNPNAGAELVDQITDLLANHGDMKRKPQTNETKSFFRVQYEPKK